MAIQAQFPYCGGSQDLMDYGCGGLNQYFNVQQQKQQLQQQCNTHQLLNYQLQRNQNLFFDSTLASASKNNNSDHLSMGTMASYDEKQRQEIDHYIRLQVWPHTNFFFFFFFAVSSLFWCYFNLD
jgi:E3 ubiquitin-protein ligase BOI-like protein